LTPAQQKLVVYESGIGGALINGAINALLAWLTFRGHAAVPLHGEQSVIADAIGTALLLPFLVCLIVTPLARRAVRAGKAEPLDEEVKDSPLLRWLPPWLVLRALALTLPCLLLLAAPAALLFSVGGIEGLPVGAFVIFKTVYAAVMGAWVSPVSALYALATTRELPQLTAATRS
jgi:hypothetical protein